jgi:hypothetical protein
MLQQYDNELMVITFKKVQPLVKFYSQFIYNDNQIILGKYLPPNPNSNLTEISTNLIPANISTQKTQKGLLMVVRANFMTVHTPPIEWLEFIHSYFPELSFYLRYIDIEKKYSGEIFTAGPNDLNENSNSSLIHIKKEIQWYDLETADLLSKLEQGFFISK